MWNNNRNPNRFATGAEAVEIQARLRQERAILELAEVAEKQAHRDLSAMTTQLRAIESQYNDMKARWEDASIYAQSAKARCTAQRDAVATYSRYFHPLRRTPPEVLSQIFEACVVEFGIDADLDAEWMPSEMYQPFRLAAVCRQWHAAMLATPRAWRWLDIDFQNLTADNLEHWHNMITTTISRSSTCLLSISIRRDHFSGQYDERLRVVAQRIADCMHRCRDFTISIDQVYEDDYIAPLIYADMPCVESVWARAQRNSVVDNIDGTIFRNSAKLTEIALSPEFIPVIPMMPRVTWLSCEQILVTAQEDCELAEINRKMPNLQTLTMARVQMEGAPQNTPLFSQLTHLTISFMKNRVIEELDRVLIAPKLNRLEVDGFEETSAKRILFARHISGPRQLTELEFMCLRMVDVSDFVRLLGLLTQLSRLNVSGTAFTRDGLRRFCRGIVHMDEDGKRATPNLLKIEFEVCSFDDCDEADLISLASNLAHGSTQASGGETNPAKFGTLDVTGWDRETWPSLRSRIDDIMKGK